MGCKVGGRRVIVLLSNAFWSLDDGVSQVLIFQLSQKDAELFFAKDKERIDCPGKVLPQPNEKTYFS